MRPRSPRRRVRALIEPIESRLLLSSYYFSPLGNDLGTGDTPATAWKSASKLNSVDLNPGDQVYFEGGQTFAGNLTFDANDVGAANNPVVLQSYGSGKATINAGSTAAVTANNVASFEIRGLNFVGGWNATTQSGSTTNGILLQNTVAGGNKLQHVRIDDVDVSGFRLSGIEVQGTTGKSGFDDLRITNTAAHDNGDCGIDFDGYYDTSSSSYAHTNIYVGYCRAYNNEGIAGKASHTGSGIILSDVNGGTIERCVAYNNGARCTYNGGGPVGIWAWDSNNITIQHNESYANRTGSTSKDGGGFDLDGGVTNSVMQYNYAHDNDGAGYLLYQFSGARAYGNNTVRYNISQNDGRQHDFAGLYIGGGTAVVNNQVYGNTFYISPTSNTLIAAVRIESVGSGNKFRNNILYSTGGVRLVSSDSAASSNNVLFQGNDYFSGGGTFVIRWGASTYSSLSAWRTATNAPQEKSGAASVGLSVDPQLVAAGAGGTIGDTNLLHTLTAYQLLATSPLIESGMNLTTLGISAGGQDYYGSAVPAGANFDIGAFESAPTYIGTGVNDTIQIRRNASGTMELLANGSSTKVWAAGVYPTFTVSGGSGNDTLQMVGATGDGYTLWGTQISRSGGESIAYSSFENLSLDNATYAANSDLAGLVLQVNAGARLNLNTSQSLGGLSVAGILDVNDNDLVVDYSTVSPVGSWTGNAYDGVTGMIAAGKIANSATTGGLHHLGVAEASQVLGPSGGTFGTLSVDGSAVLVKFTYAGDANLDGRVNIDDYTKIDSGIAAGTRGWFNGDFNLDGKINIDDYVIIDGVIGNQGQPL